MEVRSSLSLGFIAMKRHQDQGDSYKRQHLIEGGFHSRGSIRYHYGGKHGSLQADMVWEKEMKVLYLDLKAARRRLSSALGGA